MVTNYLIDKEIHPLQQELQTTVMSLSVKQFSASLSLSKPRYARLYFYRDWQNPLEFLTFQIYSYN